MCIRHVLILKHFNFHSYPLLSFIFCISLHYLIKEMSSSISICLTMVMTLCIVVIKTLHSVYATRSSRPTSHFMVYGSIMQNMVTAVAFTNHTILIFKINIWCSLAGIQVNHGGLGAMDSLYILKSTFCWWSCHIACRPFM